MIRALFRLILLAVLVIGIAAFFFGYRWGSDGPERVDISDRPAATTGERKSFAYSWQQELQMGAEADKEITEKMGLYDNPQVQALLKGTADPASVGSAVQAVAEDLRSSGRSYYRQT